MPHCSRRSFLHTTGASIAAISIPYAVGAKGLRQGRVKQINPSIPDSRVVCCYDPGMVNGVPGSDIMSQNTPVNAAAVYANMDEMAKALTGLSSPAEAWAAIFRKPAAKNWSDVTVAIKPNCIPTWACSNQPRLAVMSKICDELIRMGVSAGNILFYDFKTTTLPSEIYSGFVGNGLPAGVVLCNYVGSYTEIAAKDILVNIAVNKGHYFEIGNFTLTMKNHYGTYPPPYEDLYCRDVAHLTEINTSDAILGGDPVRQQLCIVDALWSMTGGPTGVCDYATHRLVMGTCSPAVDYMTAIHIREKEMSMQYNSAVTEAMLSSQNLTAQECTMIDVPPASSGGYVFENRHNTAQATGNLREISLSVPGRHASSAKFKIVGNTKTNSISILNTSGRLVRRVPVSTGNSIIWDGKDDHGREAGAGRYIISHEKAGMAVASFSLF